jgi:hypothetical protein
VIRTAVRGGAAALVAAMTFALPAMAQQASELWAPLPQPADSHMAVTYDPQFTARADDDRRRGCMPGLQCRVQLRGVIQRYGGVELRATAFTW